MDTKRATLRGSVTTAALFAAALVAAPGATAPQGIEAPPGPAVQESSACALCHSNAPAASAMRDGAGRAVAPYDLWSGTMMANAARDPLWRAAVSAEVAATPSRRAEIEAKCLSCHAPLADRAGLDDHGTGSVTHLLDCDSTLGELARDGVSCTICHGIAPEGLGTEASFGAGFELDDHRRLFGPHAAPFAMPMLHHTGFTPARGDHVRTSALCATCHTLETETFDAEGNVTGSRLLEQAPYLEWRNSAYRDEGTQTGATPASCQECHVPTRDEDGDPIQTRIARNPGGRDFPPIPRREPFGRHVFVGGNTLVPALLRDHGDELGATAPPAAFQATLDSTREQLQRRTARLSIASVRHASRALSFAVEVENLTGHKLPTGHPTRRAWLAVTVRGTEGEVLFSSGTADARGRIVGADGQPLPSELAGGPVVRHRDVVRTPNEVATYEAVMADDSGLPTYTLLRGAAWLVDDRLLPKGWRAEHPEAARTAPVGLGADGDFADGRDRVRYELDLARAEPVTIEAALLYQPLGARWAAELLRWDTPEITHFRRLYEEADRTPEVLASATWRSPGPSAR